jgi:hypothetical protein
MSSDNQAIKWVKELHSYDGHISKFNSTECFGAFKIHFVVQFPVQKILLGNNVTKLSLSVIYEFFKEAGVFVPGKLFQWVKPGAYPKVEHLKGASVGSALALPAKIRLGWKNLPRTNTLAYNKNQ